MNSKRIVIIGGGISGLTAAYEMQKQARKENLPVQITLLEARPRFGGSIETVSENGFLLEGGADAFLSEKTEALDFCRELGILDQIQPTSSNHRRSFLCVKGRLHEIPQGFYLMAPTKLSSLFKLPGVSWRGKLRMIAEYFVPPKQDHEDESVGSFARRRLGEEAARQLVQPMVGGIYAADIDELSLQATFPRFLEIEKNHGSLGKYFLKSRAKAALNQASGPRYSLFVTLKGGMGFLIQKIRETLTDVEIRCGTAVTELKLEDHWKVFLKSGEALEADAVCLALPACKASELLAPVDKKLSTLLAGIPYRSLATVHLGYASEVLPEKYHGFGFVVPASERSKIIGCAFSSLKFEGRAPQNTTLIRAFVGGEGYEMLKSLDDVSFAEEIRKEVEKILGSDPKIGVRPRQFKPVLTRVFRHPHAMPAYKVEHLKLVEQIEKEAEKIPGLYLSGNAYRGIGIPDCIRQARTTAKGVIQHFKNGVILSEAKNHR